MSNESSSTPANAAATEPAQTEAASIVAPCPGTVDGRRCLLVAGHDFGCVPAPYSQAEKIDYLFAQAKQLEALVEQAGPLLEKAGPMLDSLAPLLGQASSPMSRIAGAFLR